MARRAGRGGGGSPCQGRVSTRSNHDKNDARLHQEREYWYHESTHELQADIPSLISASSLEVASFASRLNRGKSKALDSQRRDTGRGGGGREGGSS